MAVSDDVGKRLTEMVPPQTQREALITFCPFYKLVRPFLASLATSATGLEAVALNLLLAFGDQMCP